MASWVEVHATLPDHPKVLRAAKALKIDSDALVGKLVRLWTWAVDNREDGILNEFDVEKLSERMNYKGDNDALIGVLVIHGLLDDAGDGCLEIHDWTEHVEMLVDKREKKRKQTAERVKRWREKQKNCECNPLEGEHPNDKNPPNFDAVTQSSVTCNALQERFSCNACNSRTVPNRTIPYLTVPNSNELENNEDKKEIDKEKAPKVVRHKYGVYGNVLLSDADMEKLKAEFPNDWGQRIERLSEYIASKGAKYKDHLATIRSWARKEKPNEKRGRDTGGAFDAVGTYL